MTDLKLRELEARATRNPEDLELQRELRQAYLRTGRWTPPVDDEEIISFCKTVWPYGSTQTDFSIVRHGDELRLRVTAMYDYNAPAMNARILEKLYAFFGTKNIDDAAISKQGCETCDHGSSYGFELVIKADEQEN